MTSASIYDIYAHVFVALVAVVFSVGGSVELVRWRAGVPQFVQWGYPRYWPVVTSILKIIFGVMSFIPAFRVVGFAGLSLICLAGLGTVIKCRTSKFYLAAVVVTALGIFALGVAIYIELHPGRG